MQNSNEAHSGDIGNNLSNSGEKPQSEDLNNFPSVIQVLSQSRLSEKEEQHKLTNNIASKSGSKEQNQNRTKGDFNAYNMNPL